MPLCCRRRRCFAGCLSVGVTGALLKTWAIAHEKGHTCFSEEVRARHVYMWHARVYDPFFLIQDIARHQPKELVAKIESRAWCGELHLGRFEARLFFILSSKTLLAFAFSWPGRQAILVACLR